MKNKIVIKKDFIIIGIVLLLALISFLFIQMQNKNSTPTGEVEIYVDGNLYKNVKIDEGTTEVIKQDNGLVNELKFTHNGVFMNYSSCNNQLCVHQGEVNFDNYSTRFLGNSIICLPNRVVVSLVVDEEENTKQEVVPDAY